MMKYLILLVLCFQCTLNSVGQSCIIEYPYRNINTRSKEGQEGVFLIRDRKRFEESCINASNLVVDFKNEYVIGFVYRNHGCSKPKIYLEFKNNPGSCELECNLVIENTGGCKLDFSVNKWIVIQKPDDRITVVPRIIKTTIIY